MKFKKIDWFDGLELIIAEALGNDTELLRTQVNTGTARLWMINNGESFAITRAEHDTLVVCCYQGRSYNEAMKLIMRHAQIEGFTFIRGHTYKKGIARMMRRLGGTEIEHRSDGEYVYAARLRWES